MAADKSSLQSKLAAAGQEHVIRFWDSLDGAGRARLATDIDSIDLLRVNRYFRESTAPAKPKATDANVDSQLDPIPSDMIGSASRTDAQTLSEYYDDGEAANTSAPAQIHCTTP